MLLQKSIHTIHGTQPACTHGGHGPETMDMVREHERLFSPVNTDHVKKVLLCNSFYQHGPQTRVAYTADPFVQPVFMTDEHGQCVSSLNVIFMAFYFPSGCLSGCSLTLFVTHYLCSVKLTTSVHHVNVNVSFSALILRFSHLACKIIPKMTYYVLSEVLSLYTRHVNGKSGKGFQVQRSRSLGLKFMVSL